MNKQWIQLGIVGKAHGLGGAFFISQRDDILPRSLTVLRIGLPPETAPQFKIKYSRMQTGRPVLHCVEIGDRDSAEKLVGMPIWGLRSDLGLDETTEYLWADLIGKTVVDSTGAHVGILVQVGNFGASDIVQLRRASGGVLDVPFVKAYFDFSFTAADEQLRMLVPLSTFDGTWSDD